MTDQTTVHDEHDAAAADELLHDTTETLDTDGASPKLVPVTESIRYRRRAQAAENRLSELQAQFQQIEQDLHETRATLDQIERRRSIDEMLIDADTIDLEAARLLTEAAVAVMDEQDIHAAVDELRQRKPYLFRQHATEGRGSMSPRPRPGDNGQLGDAAEHAATSGDRRDLLRYLRLRRGTK